MSSTRPLQIPTVYIDNLPPTTPNLAVLKRVFLVGRELIKAEQIVPELYSKRMKE